jgi:transcriptional regulator with XRE-family HTH domain
LINWGIHIRRLRETKGLTQEELAEKVGITRSLQSRIELGHFQAFSQDRLERYARALEMTPAQLSFQIYGQSEKETKENTQQLLRRLASTLDLQVPLYDEFPIHAGPGSEITEYVPVARSKVGAVDPDRLKAFPVRGMCMSPEIEEGDVVIVDTRAEINVNNIVACQYNGEVHIGRIMKIDGHLYLQNGHGRYPFEECHPAIRVIKLERDL